MEKGIVSFHSLIDKLSQCFKVIYIRDTARGHGLRTTLQVFSACNYYASVATTIVMLCLSGVHEISQCYKNWYSHAYLTQAQKYSRYTVQIFATSFLKLCASVRSVFSVYTPHKYC